MTSLLCLLFCQAAGEPIVRLTHLPVPAIIVGVALMLLALYRRVGA